MVKFIRSLFALAGLASIIGCEPPDLHLYTQSISKSIDTYMFREIPKELFNGTYQRLNYYDGKPEGLVTFNTNRCKSLGFDLIADLDRDATCKDNDAAVIKMNKIVQIRERLFVEANVKIGPFTSRYALFELIPTKDKFVLTQMVYDTDKLMESGLNFSKSRGGLFRVEGTIYEVQNKTGQSLRLLEVMKHGKTFESIHFKATSAEQDQKIRELLKGRWYDVRTQEFPFGIDKACAESVVIDASEKGYVLL